MVGDFRLVCAVVAVGLAGFAAHGQFVASGGQSRSSGKADAVQYLFPEQVTVAAGKASQDYLIATSLTISAGAGVKLDGATYPAGTEMSFPMDPKTKLSVYTGEFIIQARIVAMGGDHLVEGKLRYQACDRNECMPPKTITVPIDVIGK
jgi:hypothetical protein